jgi:hypothetical protein
MKHIALSMMLSAVAGAAFAVNFDGSNLITNAGGEADAGRNGSNQGVWLPITGWTGNASLGVYSDTWYEQPGGANPNKETNFFYGGYSQPSSSTAWTTTLTQTIDISSQSAAIDAGLANFVVSGWFGGWNAQEDTAKLITEFWDANNNLLESWTIGGPNAAARNNVATMLFSEEDGEIPTLARSVKLTISLEKAAGGSANDGAADSLYFGATADVVPEPATMALLALGAAAFVRRRRS